MVVRRHYIPVATNAVDWTWDPAKDRLNRARHGLSLADAVPALADPLAMTRLDPDPREERWQTIGGVGTSAVVLVVHTDPVAQPDGRFLGRIISVRRATRHERKAYEEGTV
jgi:uncharacterized DUF497 family protein